MTGADVKDRLIRAISDGWEIPPERIRPAVLDRLAEVATSSGDPNDVIAAFRALIAAGRFWLRTVDAQIRLEDRELAERLGRLEGQARPAAPAPGANGVQHSARVRRMLREAAARAE